MPSCNTYSLTWVSVTLDVGYLFTTAPANCSLLLTLDEGYLLTAAPSDLELGIAPLGPPVPVQPPFLGGGVGSPSRCPWPRAWCSSSRPPPLAWTLGSSSRLPPLGHGVLLASAPDLGRGVAALGAAAHAKCAGRSCPH